MPAALRPPKPATKPAAKPPTPRAVVRDWGWDGDRLIPTVSIALLSLVVALATFHVVSGALGDRTNDRTDNRTSGAGGAQAGSGGTAAKARKDGSASRSRTPASGEFLAAASPLDQIRQDQGSSVELPDGRTLWIFADTFQRTRTPRFFVTSSAALTDPGGGPLTYSTKANRTPAEFLPRTAAEHRGSVRGEHYKAVWPVGSTLLPDGRIIIAYAKYEVLLKTGQFDFLGSGLFSYRYTTARALRHGGVATRIADDIWAPYEGAVRSPVYDDGYVYFTQCEALLCYSLRTTPAGLSDRLSYRWWTGSTWSKERSARAAVTVGSNHPGGNSSVVKLSSGLFAMADTEAGAPSSYGYLWVARRPQGPWSRAASYIMPGCEDGGCYGLNLHPDQSTSSLLRLSYATTDGPHVRITDVDVSIAADGSAVSAQ